MVVPRMVAVCLSLEEGIELGLEEFGVDFWFGVYQCFDCRVTRLNSYAVDSFLINFRNQFSCLTSDETRCVRYIAEKMNV